MSSSMMAITGGVCLAFLVISALGAVYRIAKGPSILDRAIATDVLLITVSIGLCVQMAMTGSTSYIIFVVVASLIGFVGSVTVSRFTIDTMTRSERQAQETEPQYIRDQRKETSDG